MRILVLTGSSNTIGAEVARCLLRKGRHEISFVFLNYVGKRGFSQHGVLMNLRNSGLVFLVNKAWDILNLQIRMFLRRIGILLNPVFPLEIAKVENLAFTSVADVNSTECVERMKRFGPDLLVTAGFGQILEKEVIGVGRIASLNVHPSLLPDYSGPNPFRDVLKAGDKTAGVTVHRLTEEVDSGEILAQVSYPISWRAGQRKLRRLAAEAGGKLLVEVVDDIELLKGKHGSS